VSSYKNFDYQAELKRNGCLDCTYGLIVRGQPEPLGDANRWHSGYGFYITRNGYFGIFKYTAGNTSLLQDWVITDNIEQGEDAWNTLFIEAKGDHLAFYINSMDEPIWEGQDPAYLFGKAEILMYTKLSGSGDQIKVAWAKLHQLTSHKVVGSQEREKRRVINGWHNLNIKSTTEGIMIAKRGYQSVLIILICISQFMGWHEQLVYISANNSPSAHAAQIQQPAPVARVSGFSVQAPWPANILWHAGGNGNFYHDCEKGSLKRHCKWDDFAIDFNGNEKDSKGDLTGETDDNEVLVLAVADGTVEEAEKRSDGYGWNVVISHAYGYQSRYAHLKDGQLLVTEGNWVAQGTPLGYVSGSGGYTPHLHFAMYYCDPKKTANNCNQYNNLQAVIPEPLNGNTNIKDSQQILSTTNGVGFEEIKAPYKFPTKPISHPQFLETYKRYGGQFFGFGIVKSPVKLSDKSGVYYQEFFPQQNQAFPWSGIPFTLVEIRDKAFLFPEPVWQEYERAKGPQGKWGEPINDAYEWRLNNNYGFRVDFTNGSMIYNTNGSLEFIDEQNASWTVEFFDNLNFAGAGAKRIDKNIDFLWPIGTSPGPIRGYDGFSATWNTKKSGVISISKLAITLQGHLEIWVNGKLRVKEDSPDTVSRLSKWNLGIGDQEIIVKFWQDNRFKEARLKVTVEGISIIPPAFASEGEILTGSPPIPEIAYADYEPPPFPGDIIIPPLPSGGSTSTILVFDSSGSMNEQDASGVTKLIAAKTAGQSILDVIKAETQAADAGTAQVGLVDFNFLPNVDAQLSTDISVVETALQNMYADGGTGMPDGLKTGLDLFPQLASDAKPILILLSDGVANIGHGNDQSLSPDEVKIQVIAQAERAKQMGVCIYTVGFGVPGGIGSFSGDTSIDEELLKQIPATAGCGSYYNAQNAVQLTNVYVELRHTSTGNVLLKQEGSIAQGQRVDIGSAQVPANQSLLLLTLNWPGSRLDPLLYDPGGRQVDTNYPGASISLSETLANIVIDKPRAGQWQVAAMGADVPQGTTTYHAILSARPSAVPPSSSFGPGILVVIPALVGGGVAIYALRRRPSVKRPLAGSPGAAAASLTGIGGSMAGISTQIPPAGLLIGRGSDCTLRLTDRAASRQHARLAFGQGNWYLQDLGSKGGTYVNGIWVNAIGLKDGDRIRVGNSEFLFRCHSG